jgi:hypothetical protein
MIVMISASIIPVPIMIPAVLVLYPALVTFPIALEIFTIVITWSHPVSPRVRCQRPVTLVPFPVVSYWIPIAVDPHVIRSGPLRKDTNHPLRWRWTDSDSKRNLAKNLSSGQECNTEQNCSKKPVHVFRPPDLLSANTLPKMWEEAVKAMASKAWSDPGSAARPGPGAGTRVTFPRM